MIVVLTLMALAASASANATAAETESVVTFKERCAVCHASGGGGVPGIYPRLRGRVARMTATPVGRDYVTQVILFGLAGPVKVDGLEINGVMPAFADLSDDQIALLVGYVSDELGPARSGGGSPVLPADVARLRSQKVSPSYLHGIRARVATAEIDAAEQPAAPATSRLEPAREDYVRACQGCHGADGCTDPDVTPPLRGTVGYFTRSEEGRAYLVRVPGVALSTLDDERLARLMNWVLSTMSGPELRPGFRPYQAAEVAQLRRRAFTEVTITRAQLVESLISDTLPRAAFEGRDVSGCSSQHGHRA